VFTGVIFDFNGVLWWDDPLHIAAWEHACQLELRCGLPREHWSGMKGRSNKSCWETLLDRSITREEELRLTDLKERIYRELCLAQGEAFRLSPGAVDLLNFLQAQNVPRTIATSSERTNLAFYFEHLPLSRWFELPRVIYDDGTFPLKPNPEIYLRAARMLDLAPQDCVVVEDASSGIEAARLAGIGAIIALGPPERQAELAKIPGVTTTIVDFNEFDRHLFFN
jgi:HAD superfamily hydrolase (TIGR01509 family)